LLGSSDMPPNGSPKKLGSDPSPGLKRGRGDRVRTLAYDRLPNGDLNPIGFGAPLALAPRPPSAEPPPPPPPRLKLVIPQTPPRPSSRSAATPSAASLPVVSLRRAHESPAANDAPSASPATSAQIDEEFAWPLVRRVVAEPTPPRLWRPSDPFVVRAPARGPSGARRTAVRVVASLAILAGLVGVGSVAGRNPAALHAVAVWAALGQLR
jgi:hypothetical protein